MSYDLQAETTNGVHFETTVVALTGFTSEFNISVWNVDATAAPAIDAIHGFTSGGAIGVYGRSDANGVGVRGEVTSGTGTGVQGQGGNVSNGSKRQTPGMGVVGIGGTASDNSPGAPGVKGVGGGGSNKTTDPLKRAVGVFGQGGPGGPGVVGSGIGNAFPAPGVEGFGTGLSYGVAGIGGVSDFGDGPVDGGGVEGYGGGSTGLGVAGIGAGASTVIPSGGPIGVFGRAVAGADGVRGNSDTGNGVMGETTSIYQAGAASTAGVSGNNLGSGPGVKGTSTSGDAVIGVTTSNVHAGVSAVNDSGGFGMWARGTPAGHFEGNVEITGFLSKAGGGFKIDHPEDPANRYLNHSFVESAEMKNVYDGTVTVDAQGKATVTMPSWFEALNRSFCYQLTPIGMPSPELHVASELHKGKFQIAGGKAGSKVSWQVTGVRNDAWAKANEIPVEEEKNHRERGHYLHPSLFGQSEAKNVLAAQQSSRY
jgi:hypothetical protein